MSTLIFLLPTNSAGQAIALNAQSMVQYALVNAAGMLTNQGSKRLNQLPKATETVLLLPTQWVSWHTVQLPKLDKSLPTAKRKALLGGLLEEHVLSDIGDLHFALPANAQSLAKRTAVDAQQPTWIAVTNKTPLGHALTELAALGLDVDRILPQLVPTQVANEQRVLVTGTPETATVHIADNHGTLTVPLTHFQALGLVLEEDTIVQAEPAVAQQAENILHRSVQLLQAGQALTQTHASPWNLAQFDFATSKHRWVRRVSKGFSSFLERGEWRWARWALGGLLLMNIVGLGVWQWQLKQQTKNNQVALTKAFRAAFPEAKGPVPDAERMAGSHLQRLEKSRARLKATDMEPLLMASAPVLATLGADVQLDYADGELSIRSAGLEAQDFDALQTKLQAKGYDLQKNNTTWVVRVLDGEV